MTADELLNSLGFELIQVVDAPIPGVREDAKMYTYSRAQTPDSITFDNNQDSIRFTSSWYTVSDLEAIISKAKELGIK